ncbi:hypothetical protein AAFF_G00240870 [Aldrovandia affinis]|uniref:Uncharacterized protein n=1 Tax=Aldrovandia affinis TaxID=143900 RepID=A0AAD7SUP8_9TELE|nr:hypothetical protein AAFF_G00240870 [Aldrovandia affinis]
MLKRGFPGARLTKCASCKEGSVILLETLLCSQGYRFIYLQCNNHLGNEDQHATCILREFRPFFKLHEHNELIYFSCCNFSGIRRRHLRSRGLVRRESCASTYRVSYRRTSI